MIRIYFLFHFSSQYSAPFYGDLWKAKITRKNNNYGVLDGVFHGHDDRSVACAGRCYIHPRGGKEEEEEEINL